MKFAARDRRRATSVRRGAALVVALTTLLIVMLITGAVLRSIMHSHRQSRQLLNQLQATWLAEGAIERARAKLRQSADYDGETWRPALSAHSAANDSPAVAEIRVERPANSKTARVTVDAHFPDDPWQRASIQRSYEFPVSNSLSTINDANHSRQEKAP